MKRFLRRLFPYVIWALAALLVTGWLFDRRTDPPADEQIILLIDGCPADTEGLERALLPHMPEGIRYIRARLLSWAFFDTETGLPRADLYILPDSEAAEWTQVLREEALLYDPAADGCPAGYISFGEGGGAGQCYRLYSRADGDPASDHGRAVLELAARLVPIG